MTVRVHISFQEQCQCVVPFYMHICTFVETRGVWILRVISEGPSDEILVKSIFLEGRGGGAYRNAGQRLNSLGRKIAVTSVSTILNNCTQK